MTSKHWSVSGPRACVWKNDKCTWSPDVIAECKTPEPEVSRRTTRASAGFIFLIIVGVLIVVGLFVGGIIYSLKGGGFHHNPEIPWGYSPKARTASTGKPKEVAVQKDTEAA